MSEFMNHVEDAIGNVSITENGAVGYKTTGHALLDLNFATSSLRSVPETEIADRFKKVFAETPHEAILWLFFARDIRGGMGERRLFRVCMKWLSNEHPEIAIHLIPLISEYGRWDDVIDLMETRLSRQVIGYISEQLLKDITAMNKKGTISLLAKWMPNEHSEKFINQQRAFALMRYMDLTPKRYRLMLSALRKYLDVVEVKTSSNRWRDINYEGVPSKANLRYRKAFLRHDEERRNEYLQKVSSGEKKINSSTAYPYEIFRNVSKRDATLEEMWKALPNVVPKGCETIVVADGSGSMQWESVSDNSATAWQVAHSLAVYFSERMSSSYKDKYITFSSRPQFVDLSDCKTLYQKKVVAERYNECSNTNIEAVFQLILDLAVRKDLKQEDLPKNILILSDMEFDEAQQVWAYEEKHYWNKRLLEKISNHYARHGYKIPRLIFWNICGRTETIPMKENENGVVLVSGFSPNTFKMVMSGKLDPWEALLDTLHSKRYEPVLTALGK